MNVPCLLECTLVVLFTFKQYFHPTLHFGSNYVRCICKIFKYEQFSV